MQFDVSTEVNNVTNCLKTDTWQCLFLICKVSKENMSACGTEKEFNSKNYRLSFRETALLVLCVTAYVLKCLCWRLKDVREAQQGWDRSVKCQRWHTAWWPLPAPVTALGNIYWISIHHSSNWSRQQAACQCVKTCHNHTPISIMVTEGTHPHHTLLARKINVRHHFRMLLCILY